MFFQRVPVERDRLYLVEAMARVESSGRSSPPFIYVRWQTSDLAWVDDVAPVRFEDVGSAGEFQRLQGLVKPPPQAQLMLFMLGAELASADSIAVFDDAGVFTIDLPDY